MEQTENPKTTILHLLEEYRKKYLFTDTLTTQDPTQVNKTMDTLNKKGTTLINYYNYPSQYVRDENDVELNNLIQSLNKVIENNKDTPIYSTLTGDYVKKLFIDFPLTPNPKHIFNNLLKTQS